MSVKPGVTSRDEWRWTDDRGVQRLVGTDELRAALASGRLPPNTLVWRDGMTAWGPADARPELENAVAIGRAVRGREGVASSEGDRSTPTGIIPAKAIGGAAAKSASTRVEGVTASRHATRTLLGIPSPLSEKPASVAFTDKDLPRRSGSTQIPERGVPPDGNVTIPRAAPLPVVASAGGAPARKLTTRDIDNLWATGPISDEDSTYPHVPGARAPLPSFDLPPGDDPARAKAASASSANASTSATSARPKAAAAAPASRPAVEAAPDRVTGPTLQSRNAAPAAPASSASSAKEAPAKAPSAKPPTPAPRVATKPATLPAPRVGGDRPATKRPPPLPGRQVTATLVAAGSPVAPAPTVASTTVANATIPAAPVPSLRASPPAKASAPEPAASARAEPLPSFADAEEVSAILEGPPVAAAAPLHLPPSRASVPEAAPQSHAANGAAPTGRSHSPLPPAPSSHDGEGYPLPPGNPLRAAPLPSFPDPDVPPHLRPSDPPPAPLASEPPPAAYLSAPPPRFSDPGAGGRGLPVAVPISSLFAAGGALIAMVVGAFLVGRASAQPPRLVARPVFHLVPLVAKASLPPPPKPCWVAKQPVMWAPRIEKSIPFDVATTAAGTLTIGYAREESEAVGIEVTPASGEVKVKVRTKASDPIERVIPAGAEFKVSTTAGAGGLTSLLPVAAASPFVLGVKAGALSFADRPESAAASLWPLAGSDPPSALRVQTMSDKGFGVTFRREGAVWGGVLDPSHRTAGALVKVAGSGGSVGKPSSGWNGREIAVIFADRPAGGERWEIRVGRAPTGQMPSATQVIPLPPGGPGGDAFAPDLAGLPDGRWLMIWTEGAAGSRAVRAQTFAPDLTPLGDPIALSPPAGNFGQGGIGIAGAYAGAVFLSKGSTGFELWGSILQCG